MVEQKPNDYLAAMFFSPHLSPQDLADHGVTPDTANLQDIEYYKEIPQIKEAFLNDKGEFDDVKFTNYYKEVEKLYNWAEDANIMGNIVNTYEYDPYDIFAPKDGKKKNLAPTLTYSPNPERRSSGITNLYHTSVPTMTPHEVGQQNRVYNYEEQKWEDYTPNELGLWKNLTRPTLVLATWDEDGTHIVDGREVSHKKGEYKFNEFGDTYYETLGNRKSTHKELLHVTDVLTVDGSTWNKWDPFDSDGFDKSVGGTIAKTALRVIPAFVPYIGMPYRIATIAIELGKVLPELWQAVEGIITGDTSDSRSAQVANDISSYFKRFDHSVSMKGKEGMFSFENIGDIVAKSFLQLNTQRLIGSIPKYINTLRGLESTENTVKWGKAMAMTYMAGTSVSGTYDVFKEAGASDRMAGLGMIASALAMYKLMDQDYFKEYWFNGTYLDNAELRNVLKEAAIDGSEKITKKEAANWVLKTSEKIAEKISQLKPTDLAYGAINEGIEETVEEIGTDAVKLMFSGLNALGLIDSSKEYDFGFSTEDIFSRYTSSFVGGAIGGAVFSSQLKIEDWKNNTSSVYDKFSKDKDSLGKLIYWVRAGKSNELHKELKRLHKRGQLGSTNLSGIEFDTVKDGNVYTTQYKAAKPNESQNDIIYQRLSGYLKLIEETLSTEGLDISDEELHQIQLKVNKPNLDKDQARELIGNAKYIELLSSNLYSKIYEDFNELSSRITQVRLEMENMIHGGLTDSKTPSALDDRIAALKTDAKYIALETELDELRKKRDDILSGQKNDEYLDLMLFVANPSIASPFAESFGLHNFTRYKYGKEYEQLTADEKITVDAAYKKYSEQKEKSDVLAAYEAFVDFRRKLTPTFDAIQKDLIQENGIVGTLQQFRINELEKQIADINAKLQTLDDADVDTKDALTEQHNNLLFELSQLDNSPVSVLQNIIGSNDFQRPNKVVATDVADAMAKLQNELLKYSGSYLRYVQANAQNKYKQYTDAELANVMQFVLAANNIESSVNGWNQWLQDKLGVADDIVTNLAVDINEVMQFALRGDLSSTFTKLNDVVNNQDYVDLDYLSILDEIVLADANGNSTSLINWLQQYKQAIDQYRYDPVYTILENAAKIIGINTNVIDVIKEEFGDLISSNRISDYFIADPIKLNVLRDVLRMLEMVASITSASSYDGINTRVNVYKEALGKELLLDISDENAETFRYEINNLYNKISKLINIVDNNNAQKVREQKDIAINMRSKFVNSLIDMNLPSTVAFAKTFNLDLKEIYKTCNFPEEIDETSFAQFENAASEFETKIYNAIKEQKLSIEVLAGKLIECFNPIELLKQKPTKLSRDPNVITSDYDQFVYLSSIIAAPTQNFNIDYKKAISNPIFKDMIPIYSQEVAVRISYSQILNPVLYNTLLKNLVNHAKNIGANIYEQTKSPMYNMVFTFGGAGVGKTKGVATIIKTIFTDSKFNASIKLAAPTKEQAYNLATTLGETSSWNKDQLLSQIMANNIEYDTIESENVIYSIKAKGVKINTVNYGDANYKLLFIDEIGLFTRPELELLSRWAVHNNINIVALGDYMQNATPLTYNGISYETGLTDTLMIKSPDLIAPLRPANIAKYDNYIQLRSALEAVWKKWYDNPSTSLNDLNEEASNYLTNMPIIFKYFENDNVFGGEKYVPKEVVNQYIDKLKKLGNVCIITDKDVYNAFGVDVKHPIEVQGREYDYVIIDLSTSNAFTTLRNLYTLTQRSTKGTIIVGEHAGLGFKSVLDQSSVNSLDIPETSKEDFKQWKNKSLENIPTDYIDGIVVSTTISNVEPKVSHAPKIDTIESTQTSVDTTPVNITSDVPVSSTPTQVITQPVQSTEPKVQPVAAINSIISDAYQYHQFITSLTDNVIKSEWNSLYQKLRSVDMKKAIHELRSYYVFGYNKLDSIPSLLNKYGFDKTELQSAKLFVVRKSSGLYLIARTSNNIEIPLLPVPSNTFTGEYNGEISIASSIKYRNRTPVTINELSQNGIFNVSPPYVCSAGKDYLTQYTEDQQKWVNKYNGRTYTVVTMDPFILNFDEYLSPSITFDQFYDYTTQKDQKYQLIGCNWIAPLSEYIEYCKHDTKYIAPNRVSTIISTCLQDSTSKDIMIKYLNKYFYYFLSNDSRRILVNNNEYTRQNINELIKFISENTVESIYFESFYNNVWIKASDFIMMDASRNNKGVSIFGLFNGLQDNELVTLQNALNNSNTFKNGIYGNDKTDWNTSSLFHGVSNTSIPGAQYISNVEIIGNDFAIDPAKINMIPEDKQDLLQVESINKQLEIILNQFADDYGYTKRYITDKQSINTAINEINKEILEKATTPNINLLRYDENTNTLSWTNKIDLYNFIINWFNREINAEQITFYSSIDSKFKPFFVSLHNGIIENYVIEEKNGTYSIREFKSAQTYSKLIDFIINKPMNSIIDSYIQAVLYDTTFDITYENTDVLLNMDPALSKLIDDYLIAKIENNECL